MSRSRKPGFTRVVPSVEQAPDRAGADRPAALADGEAEAGLERDRLAELDGHRYPVAGRAVPSGPRSSTPTTSVVRTKNCGR